MKIISWNINGLRSLLGKADIYQGKKFLQWLEWLNIEIICFQEVKAQEDQLPFGLMSFSGYHFFISSAVKKGYSGTAVLTKSNPVSVRKKIGWKRFDDEGRSLILEYPNFFLINLYLPHGGRGKENLDYKLEAYRFLLNSLDDFAGKGVILTGDFNVAHKEIDLARSKDNKNNIMFTEEERKQIDKLLALGFTDTFRKFHRKGENYSWWPYFNRARERNLGWRIDYIFTSKKLTSKLKDSFILKEVIGSDHCPIGIEMKL